MTLYTARSLQEIHAPAGRCFGCGPANDKGLRIKVTAIGTGMFVAVKPDHPAYHRW